MVTSPPRSSTSPGARKVPAEPGDGVEVGDGVGVALGSPDGASVGCGLGSGEPDGDSDGDSDGDADVVDVSVGSGDGLGDASVMVGDADGTGVAAGWPIVQALKTISDISVSRRFMAEHYGTPASRCRVAS